MLNLWHVPKLQGDRIASNLLSQVLNLLSDLNCFDHGELGQQNVNFDINLYLSLGMARHPEQLGKLTSRWS